MNPSNVLMDANAANLAIEAAIDTVKTSYDLLNAEAAATALFYAEKPSHDLHRRFVRLAAEIKVREAKASKPKRSRQRQGQLSFKL